MSDEAFALGFVVGAIIAVLAPNLAALIAGGAIGVSLAE